MRPFLTAALLLSLLPQTLHAQRPAGQAPTAAAVAEAVMANDRDKVSDAILEAAKEARDRGDISTRDYRRLRMFKLLFPRRFNALAEASLEVYVEEAPIIAADGTVSEIDFDKLLEFIRELMPIILEFIKALMDIFEPVSLDAIPADEVVAVRFNDFKPSPPEQFWYRSAA